ncbi:MAG: 4-vinyl reductase [Candidatus Verstraetearchaeota archaeon]|nr:4-vinyl reductase [Candidatus Verstraetearchaeota archaeon]
MLCGLAYYLRLEPDALALVICESTKHKIVPLYFTSSPVPYGDEVLILTFLDVTDSDIPIEQFVSKLAATGMVRALKIIEPVATGLIIDTVSHPIMAGRNRAIIFRDLAYRGFITGIKKQFGSGGEAFLYYEGIEAGLGFGKLHVEAAEAVGLKDPVEVFKRVSTAMIQWAGFGRLETLELGPSGGRIAVYDSFECEAGRGEGRPCGAFLKGVIVGVLGSIFGKDFQAEEKECIAMNQPRCVFEITEK